MFQRLQIADILSLLVGGAILFATVKMLVFWSITVTAWLCLSTLGWLVQPGGETFNLVHGFLTLGCVFASMIMLVEGVKRGVRRALGVRQ